MLASALEVVRPQGMILYCTCALSPLENDGVIEKLHRKRPGRFEIVPVHLPFGEKARYGWQVLPDDSDGRGPMYAAGVRRTT
jgi:16S rRNA C967 or C1407 C5-methylase (RsmB/RsmF family)